MSNQELDRGPSPFPADWDQADCPYHGFSKLSQARTYRPVLQLNGTQVPFGECKTREEAARAYDSLLRCFIAFTPSRAMPNFPDDFLTLGAYDAFGFEGPGCLTPAKLTAIEERLVKEFEMLGRDRKVFSEQRLREIREAMTAPDSKILSRANMQKRALARLEKFCLELAAFPIVRVYGEIGLTGDSLLVKDSASRLSKSQEAISQTVDHVSNLLADIKAALE